MAPPGLARAALLALALVAPACGGGGEEPPGYDPNMPPTTAPAMTLPSDGGTWDVSLWLYPEVARKGKNDVVFRIAERSGTAADGLTVQTQPWMPAHGHGASSNPTAAPQGAGLYWAARVNLYMSGRWELRTTIAGDVEDRVVFAVDVP